MPQHTQVVAGNSVRCEPGRRVQGRAFGKPSSMASSRRAPIAASTVWMARQPPMSSSAAPAVGASVGTVIVAMAIWENFVRAVATLEQVADDGESDRHARASSGTLNKLPQEQYWWRSGQCAANPGYSEQRARNSTTGLRP